MDEFIIASANLAKEIMPILGALALIFLSILLVKLWKLIDSITGTVKGLDPTLKKVDESILKVQAPLDTVVKYSHSLDKAHDKASEAFDKAADFANENIDNLKGYIQDKLKKDELVIDLNEAEELMKEDAENV